MHIVISLTPSDVAFLSILCYIICKGRRRKEIIVNIKKEEFERYEAVRVSGVTNMFDVGFVCYATGLEKDKVLEIMRRWDELKELYKD